MSAPRHKLLARQIRRHLAGGALGAALEAGALDPFLDAVDAGYRQADSDHALLERSLELTSRELTAQNERLQLDLRERSRMQVQLQQELAQRRATEELHRRSLVRLNEAQRVAQFGYWEVDVTDGAVFWSDQMYTIFGVEPDEVAPSLELFSQMVPEESLTRILSLVRGTRDAQLAGASFPVTWPDGTRRTLRGSGEVVRDADGRVTHVHGICSDVTEEEEYRAELVRAKERAEELLRLKTALLNNMSHELRTPLTGILGYAQLLVEEVASEQRSFAEAIVGGGRRLMETLNSVLDLAQLESGTFHLDPAPVNVRAEAAEALTLLQPLAAEKGIGLVLADDVGEVWALADRTAVYRGLTNLVGNAVKFTEAGQVTVGVEVVGHGGGLPHVRLRVADTGPGIGPGFLPHLFKEFRQESDGIERRHEGSGLGLAITKRLVDLMEGTIHVESTLGVGTVVDVTFPLASRTPAADAGPAPVPSVAPVAAMWA